jgi:hypothetical protein
MGLPKALYIQTHVKQKKEKNMTPKFHGPYNVLQNIGSEDYKLELSPTSSVHQVFLRIMLEEVYW